MEKNKKVLLGMSGGVDSSVSAILLKEQGYEVIGITMNFLSSNNENAEKDAKKVCDYLGIKHYVVDLKQEFYDHVIKKFICEYSNCRTPNPCIECNKYLKFGAMYEKAKELGADYIATGHYAKIEFDKNYNRYVLKKSNSSRKDQSYVLYNVSKEILDKILFPLADFENKDEIRNIAKKHGLSVASKSDSEDICFIPDGNYKKYLEENSEIKKNPGNIVDKNGKVLGKHDGLYYYTIGQRKGLGIAHSVPLYVLGFNKTKNEVIVGPKEELFSKEIIVKDVNWLLIDKLDEKINAKTKIRYAAKEAESIIEKIDENTVRVIFDEPQRGVTPGQSAVFYINDIVLGGGKIDG